MPPVPRKASKKSKPGARRISRPRPAPRVATARKNKPATSQPQAPAAVSLPKLRVRMYRQGLGDCFLLTFNPGGDEKHVLIDCGTLGSKTTDVKLPDVIADIDKTTNGHLHLVVGTHQHQDHLSGFPKLSDQSSSARRATTWRLPSSRPRRPCARLAAILIPPMQLTRCSASSARLL